MNPVAYMNKLAWAGWVAHATTTTTTNNNNLNFHSNFRPRNIQRVCDICIILAWRLFPQHLASHGPGCQYYMDYFVI